jgi:nitroreductase
MSAEAILAAIQGRRSIRKYTDEPVADDAVRAILEAGRWAPSGMNNQPFRFLVLRREDPRFETLSGLTKYTHIVKSCPVMIALFLDKKATYHEHKDHQSAGACIQNMMLAAHAQGLGTVWLGQMMNNAPQVLEALQLSSDEYEFITVITVGHPAEQGKASRHPLDHYMLEKF